MIRETEQISSSFATRRTNVDRRGTVSIRWELASSQRGGNAGFSFLWIPPIRSRSCGTGTNRKYYSRSSELLTYTSTLSNVAGPRALVSTFVPLRRNLPTMSSKPRDVKVAAISVSVARIGQRWVETVVGESEMQDPALDTGVASQNKLSTNRYRNSLSILVLAFVCASACTLRQGTKIICSLSIEILDTAWSAARARDRHVSRRLSSHRSSRTFSTRGK